MTHSWISLISFFPLHSYIFKMVQVRTTEKNLLFFWKTTEKCFNSFSTVFYDGTRVNDREKNSPPFFQKQPNFFSTVFQKQQKKIFNINYEYSKMSFLSTFTCQIGHHIPLNSDNECSLLSGKGRNITSLHKHRRQQIKKTNSAVKNGGEKNSAVFLKNGGEKKKFCLSHLHHRSFPKNGRIFFPPFSKKSNIRIFYH